jgi:hypothetical protein
MEHGLSSPFPASNQATVTEQLRFWPFAALTWNDIPVRSRIVGEDTAAKRSGFEQSCYGFEANTLEIHSLTHPPRPNDTSSKRAEITSPSPLRNHSSAAPASTSIHRPSRPPRITATISRCSEPGVPRTLLINSIHPVDSGKPRAIPFNIDPLNIGSSCC